MKKIAFVDIDNTLFANNDSNCRDNQYLMTFLRHFDEVYLVTGRNSNDFYQHVLQSGDHAWVGGSKWREQLIPNVVARLDNDYVVKVTAVSLPYDHYLRTNPVKRPGVPSVERPGDSYTQFYEAFEKEVGGSDFNLKNPQGCEHEIVRILKKKSGDDAYPDPFDGQALTDITSAMALWLAHAGDVEKKGQFRFLLENAIPKDERGTTQVCFFDDKSENIDSFRAVCDEMRLSEDQVYTDQVKCAPHEYMVPKSIKDAFVGQKSPASVAFASHQYASWDAAAPAPSPPSPSVLATTPVDYSQGAHSRRAHSRRAHSRRAPIPAVPDRDYDALDQNTFPLMKQEGMRDGSAPTPVLSPSAPPASVLTTAHHSLATEMNESRFSFKNAKGILVTHWNDSRRFLGYAMLAVAFGIASVFIATSAAAASPLAIGLCVFASMVAMLTLVVFDRYQVRAMIKNPGKASKKLSSVSHRKLPPAMKRARTVFLTMAAAILAAALSLVLVHGGVPMALAGLSVLAWKGLVALGFASFAVGARMLGHLMLNKPANNWKSKLAYAGMSVGAVILMAPVLFLLAAPGAAALALMKGIPMAYNAMQSLAIGAGFATALASGFALMGAGFKSLSAYFEMQFPRLSMAFGVLGGFAYAAVIAVPTALVLLLKNVTGQVSAAQGVVGQDPVSVAAQVNHVREAVTATVTEAAAYTAGAHAAVGLASSATLFAARGKNEDDDLHFCGGRSYDRASFGPTGALLEK